MIKRFFYPIGQGTFYAEKHSDFQIVYDCGCVGNKNADKIIYQNYSKEDEIDCLFISHFDSDHVSKISVLKSRVAKIKRVILPLLHEDEKILFKIFNSHIDIDNITYQLAIEPENFFDDDTTIVYISRYNENPISEETISITELDNTQKLDSGDKIKLGSNYDWVYIPFNIDNFNRRKEIIKMLNDEGIDIQKIKDDPDLIVEVLNSKRGVLSKIYKSKLVGGDINNNSLVLYSGLNGLISNNSCSNKKHYFYISFEPNYYRNLWLDECRVGCIYTGDVDLKLIDLEKIFKKYFQYVGTIQIPHHGSRHNFDLKNFQDKQFFCPISFGTYNKYGHPSYKEVVSELLSHNSIPYFVTEKLDSGFVEMIYC